MTIIDTKSLGNTIDALNEAFFFERHLPDSQRKEAAAWIAKRQGLPGCYAGMFTPTDQDYKSGIRLFTGERVTSGAATGHILGEEACRVLILLDVKDKQVKSALERASQGMLSRMERSESESTTYGTYCCGTCTPALWRHLGAGGLKDGEKRISAGLRVLKRHRNDEGRWRRFPFYWSLLALSEIDPSLAREEMRYTAPVLERYVKRTARKDKYQERRHILAERVLTEC